MVVQSKSLRRSYRRPGFKLRLLTKQSRTDQQSNYLLVSDTATGSATLYFTLVE